MSSEREHDDADATIADDVVVTKYKMAAEITNGTLTELLKRCVPGAKVLELCEFGDNRINEETGKVFKKEKELKKGVAFPTCISVNHIICHYSPLKTEETPQDALKDGDVVKIDLGTHVDGFAAIVAHTIVIGASAENQVTGRKADVVLAAYYAAEAAVRLVKPGNENFKVTDTITEVVSQFKCKPVEGMQSHQLKKMLYDGDKKLVLNPTDEQRKAVEKCTFEIHEVWTVDILVSTGEAKAKEHSARTTVYKKSDTIYQLKMKASRQFFHEISNKCFCYPFTLRALEDEKKARMGVVECSKHNLVQPLPVLCEKEGEFVAQFRFTVLLMPNGPMRITGLPVDTALYQSEHKIESAEIKDLLATAVNKRKKKKKPTDKALLDEVAAAAASTSKTGDNHKNA